MPHFLGWRSVWHCSVVFSTSIWCHLLYWYKRLPGEVRGCSFVARKVTGLYTHKPVYKYTEEMFITHQQNSNTHKVITVCLTLTFICHVTKIKIADRLYTGFEGVKYDHCASTTWHILPALLRQRATCAEAVKWRWIRIYGEMCPSVWSRKVH